MASKLGRFLLLNALTTLVAGCGAQDAGAGARDGSGGAGQADGFGNADPGGGAGDSTGDGFGNTGASGGPLLPTMEDMALSDGVCGGSTTTAEQILVETEVEVEVYDPLDIYMMVDDSGSMVPWWPATLMAISEFFHDPNSAGIGVGVQFFGSDCSAATYETPRVAIAPLPGNITALENAFPPIPIEGTATVPAMQGAVAHAQSWSSQHPDRTVVVVLVTDGLPDDCGSTVQGVVDAIAAGRTGTPSIRTFAVGLGSGLAALDMFAAAGGTDKAYLVEPGAATALQEALNAIRDVTVETHLETMLVETPLDCEWTIPAPDANKAFEKDKVNVKLGSTSASTPELGKVASAADCAANGWHYDNAGAPTRIIACPQTCTLIQSTPQATVDIQLGCPSIPLE